MTAKAALCEYLLQGKVLNIKNCFSLIGLTNCPREISRMIEKPFGVVVSRLPRTGKSRFGQSVVWIDYRLNKTEYNKDGIDKMRAYLAVHKTDTDKPVVEVRAHTRTINKETPTNNMNPLFGNL